MKYFSLICIVVVLGFNLNGQVASSVDEGSVSYVTSQNIYVKFNSTKQISVGDTLFVKRGDKSIAVLKVTNISSISCVGVPISDIKLKVDDKLITKQKKLVVNLPVSVKNELAIDSSKIVSSKPDSIIDDKKKPKSEISGRLAIASYSNFSNTPGGNSQRMRYTFSMNAKNIGGSKFSTESYISFVHSDSRWDEIKDNIFNGLKIYNLNVKYEPSESLKIWLGRRINPSISNIGAIDGLQAEKRIKSITIGAFAGSRPDYMDYSFNFDLLQLGAYLSHSYSGKQGNMQSTLAFIEQKNNGKTDRRFAYFQHYNSLVKKLYFFASAELELYQNVYGVSQSDVNLTNLYLMLRYRVVKQLSFSLSYRSQSNMIYYETYKDYVEQLIDQATIQGFRFQVNYRPIKYLSIGAKVGYRDSKQDPRPTKNAYGYVSYSRIPWINASATVSATFLETSYISGRIYSLNLSRDLIPGKLYGGISYRYVDYQYVNYEATLIQHVGDVNLTWRIIRKLSLSMAYEGVFESENKYNRLYINLIKKL